MDRNTLHQTVTLDSRRTLEEEGGVNDPIIIWDEPAVGDPRAVYLPLETEVALLTALQARETARERSALIDRINDLAIQGNVDLAATLQIDAGITDAELNAAVQ